VKLPHEKLAAGLTNRADLQEARGRQQHLQQWSAMLTTKSMPYPELFSREKQKITETWRLSLLLMKNVRI